MPNNDYPEQPITGTASGNGPTGAGAIPPSPAVALRRLPVVSSDRETGPAEIIRDQVDRLLTPANDVNNLATAIGIIRADGARRGQMAQSAVEANQRCHGLVPAVE